MGINYCLESALKMKSVSSIIIIMKYLPLLPARFCQIQESISAWLPNETLRNCPPCTCVHVHTHTVGYLEMENKRNHFHLGKGSSYFEGNGSQGVWW